MWLAEQSLGAAPEPLRCILACSGPANQDMGSGCLTLLQLQMEFLAHSACPSGTDCHLSETVIL